MYKTLSIIMLSFVIFQLHAQAQNNYDSIFLEYNEKYIWSVPKEIIEKGIPGAVDSTNFYEELVPQFILPDLFKLNNGEKVKSVSDWEHQRRNELLELFCTEVFGKAPPKPEQLKFETKEQNTNAIDGTATFKKIAISFKLADDEFIFHLKLYVPNNRKGKVPLFLLLNHRQPSSTEIPVAITSQFWPIDYIISRGYATAAIDVAAEVDPDRPNADTGVRIFYKNYGEFSWGTIAAWAWSASRAVDYFETDPDIDIQQIAIIGHSRGGKTSLWAGAQDTRFSLVIPNCAGDAGPALVRRRYGNTIEVMTSRNPHWFVPRYAEYAGKENLMPIDQHMLVALIAPRAYHGGDGALDLWHDPKGSWLSLVEASKIWEMYGKIKTFDNEMPLVNELLIEDPIAYHIREGGHGLFLFDWKLYLDQADLIFFNH